MNADRPPANADRPPANADPPIVACATPFGTSAIAVVRVTGAGTAAILRAVAGALPRPRRASVRALRDGDGVFDEGMVTWFPGPGSYTGEDLGELSCHGNPLLLDRLVRACLAAGARLATAGEFTRRALMHGRLDLVRAEAVLATLTATSAEGLVHARAAGGVAAELEGLRARLVEVASDLEAMLDYPGEDLLFPTEPALERSIATVGQAAAGLLSRSEATRVAIEGARVALVGPVNAGKSTLINALAGQTRVLTSPLPGTTRDVVEVTIQLRTARVVFLDTAGERITGDSIEAAGLALGRTAAAAADLRLFVFPLHLPWDPAWDDLLALLPPPVLRVGTHLDLAPSAEGCDVALSAPSGVGVPALLSLVVARLGGADVDPSGVVGAPGLVSARQVDLLRRFVAHIEAARAASIAGPAVRVEELYSALGVLDDLLGRDTREDVLDRLFARFCVGK